MNPSIVSNQRKIDDIIKKYRTADDDHLKKDIARYTCVLTSGFIEESIKVIVNDYTKGKSTLIISNYVNSKVKRITNCHFNKIVEILKSFNHKWADDFCKKVKNQELIENQYKDIVDSVVATRHLIAHGKSTGISLVRIDQYYQCVKKVVQIIDDSIN